MMKLSIFTPTHDPKYLVELYQSIKSQPYDEWVIVTNKNAVVPAMIVQDPRTKTRHYESDYVGALKKFACSKCTGDILLEVDHDDLLMPGAVEKVKKAFADPAVGFVYSESANFKGNFEKVERYSEAYGWKYQEFEYKGHKMEYHISHPELPSTLSRIWYCPNHLRAWRKDVYNKIGGHNPDMRVLDDQDIIARTYLATKFAFIPECLYLYRITGENTWLKHNEEIQNNVMRIYEQYIEAISCKWAHDRGLSCLDLGGRFNGKEGFTSVDLQDADMNCDLNEKWPWANGSVGVIRAYDIFEHLTDPLHTMKEVFRVLAPDGILLSQTPSTDGRGAFQDPTHKSFWNENSFLYYTHANWAQYIDTPVKMQAINLYTTEKNAQQVCWVRADLVKFDKSPGLREI